MAYIQMQEDHSEINSSDTQGTVPMTREARCDRHGVTMAVILFVTHRINKRTYDGRNRMGTCDVMQMEVYADLEK